MKTPEQWFDELTADRPEDFSPEDRVLAVDAIRRIQADTRVFSDDELELMAAACWNRAATVKWGDFFTGPRSDLRLRYIEDMRRAVAALPPP